MNTMRWICCLLKKRLMPAGGRGINPRGGATLTETVEIIVVEEQLRHEEARSCVDLLLQVLDVDLRVDAIDMPLGIRRSAHAKTGIGKRGDEVLREAELGGLDSCRDIAAQREDVLDVVRAQILDGGRNRRRGRPRAGEVRTQTVSKSDWMISATSLVECLLPPPPASR